MTPPPGGPEAAPLLRADRARIAVDDVVAIEALSITSSGDRVLLVGDVRALFAALTFVPLVRVSVDEPGRRGEAFVVGGELQLAGRDVASGAHVPIMGAAPLDPPLPPAWTVEEYVRWSARLAGMGARAGRELAASALSAVGLAAGARRLVRTLALPERRALVLAHAVVAAPDVLVAEAPLAGLEGPAAAFVLAAVGGATSGRRALLSAARIDPATLEGEVARQASYVGVVAAGEVLLEGAPGDVLAGARVFGLTVHENFEALAGELGARGIRLAGGPRRCSATLPAGAGPRDILAAAAAARAPILELLPLVG